MLYSKLDEPTCATLRGLGFTAAATDGVDLEFFERFRIERSYLSDAHNAKFKACLAARRGAGGPSAAAGAPTGAATAAACASGGGSAAAAAIACAPCGHSAGGSSSGGAEADEPIV